MSLFRRVLILLDADRSYCNPLAIKRTMLYILIKGIIDGKYFDKLWTGTYVWDSPCT